MVHRQAVHDCEDADEVAALLGQQLGERGAAAGLVVGQDHLAHGGDARRRRRTCARCGTGRCPRRRTGAPCGVGGGVGVGAHLHAAVPVGPVHQRAEVAGQLGLDRRHLAGHDLAGGAVERDDVALRRARGRRSRSVRAGQVDRDAPRARDAGPAHAARHHRRVAGHAAARGQDALAPRACRGCPRGWSRRGPGSPSRRAPRAASAVSASNTIAPEAAPGDAGRPVAEHVARRVGIERRVQQLVERQRDRRAGSPSSSSISPSPTMSTAILQRGLGGALAGAGLQHAQLAALDRELDVLHVAVVLLEQVEHARPARRRPRASPLPSTAAWRSAASRAALVRYCGVRMPATTSSPWALISHSP